MLKYLERITLKFSNFIHMNPLMVLYLTINQINSRHYHVSGPRAWETEDILWIEMIVV